MPNISAATVLQHRCTKASPDCVARRKHVESARSPQNQFRTSNNAPTVRAETLTWLNVASYQKCGHGARKYSALRRHLHGHKRAAMARHRTLRAQYPQRPRDGAQWCANSDETCNADHSRVLAALHSLGIVSVYPAARVVFSKGTRPGHTAQPTRCKMLHFPNSNAKDEDEC